MKNNTKTIALYATLGALIFVAMTMDRAFTPYLPLSAAFITLTVTYTFALVRPSLLVSFVSGLIFGFSSCITAVFFGKTSVINPLISVLPRAVLGFVLFGTYVLMRGILKRSKPITRESLSIGVAAAITTATNTVLFLFALVLFGEGNSIDSVFKVTILANAIPELVITTVLVPLVTLGVRRGLRITDEFGNRSKTATPANPENTDDFRFVQSDFAETDEHIEKPDETTATSARTDLTDTKETK